MGRRKSRNPKKFSPPKYFMKVGSRIDTNKIDAYEIFQQRRRVATTTGRRDQVMPIKDNSFMELIPDTKHPMSIKAVDANDQQVFDEFGNPVRVKTARGLSLEAAKLELNEREAKLKPFTYEFWHDGQRRSGYHHWHYKIWKKVPGQFVFKIYFCNQRWVLVQEFETYYKYSIEYGSEARLIQKWNEDKINWLGLKNKDAEKKPPKLDLQRIKF